jgi:Arc/MetJ-type ribon-helix-helix transcriptional regulator
MTSPVTLRLDKETRQRIARVARRRQVSVSEMIREAIDAWIQRQDASGAPYNAVADLIGVVHGKNPKRSTATGRQFSELLKGRRSRS